MRMEREMGNDKHTPGTWSVETAINGTRDIFDATGIRLAIVTSGPANFVEGGLLDEEHPVQGPANARLIAAAPKMYDFIVSRAEAGDLEASKLMDEIHAGR